MGSRWPCQFSGPGKDASITIWNLRSGEQDAQIKGAPTGVSTFQLSYASYYDFLTKYSISEDGWTCAESADERIAIWDLKNHQLRAVVKRAGIPEGGDPKALTGDGTWLAAKEANWLKVWDTMTHNEAHEVGRLSVDAVEFAFGGTGRDPKELWIIDRAGRVLTWRPGPGEATPRTICTLQQDAGPLPLGNPYLPQLSGNRNRILLETWRGGKRVTTVFDTGSGKPAAGIPLSSNAQETVVIDHEGSRFATLRNRSTLRVWDLRSGKSLVDLGEVGYVSQHPRMSSDGRYLAVRKSILLTAGAGGNRPGPETTVQVYSIPSGNQGPIFSLPVASPGRSGPAIAEGARLVAVADGLKILIADAIEKRALAPLEGHTDSISDLAFDRPGKLLASASVDGTVRLWAPASGKLLATLDTGEARTTRVALSPSGRWLAVGYVDGRVRLWDLFEVRVSLRSADLDWKEPTGP